MARVSAIGAVLWWHRCGSSDDSVAGIVLNFRTQSEQVQSLKHLSSDTAETEPCLNGIGLAGVGPPVVLINPPLDVTRHPSSDNSITGRVQNDGPAIQLKRVHHFWVV